MGSMSSLYAQVMMDHLCGSCRLFSGNVATGNLTGSCPISGNETRTDQNPCGLYLDEEEENE